jgi:hypothetical protein
MAGVVEPLGWPGGNIGVGVALCWVNPLRPIQLLFVFHLLHPSRGQFPSDNLLSSQNRSTIPKGRPSHQRPQMRYVTFHPIKNPSDRPFRSGPSPTPVFEWITLTRSHPLFRLWCFLHLLLARFSPLYAHYATSEATEKGTRRAEGPAEADVGCPGVPESYKDIQPRRGEVQVGDSRQVGDLCLPSFVCRSRSRSRSRSLAGRKSDRRMFSNEGVYCYVAPFLLFCLHSLHCTVSFLYARTDVRVILFLGIVSCPFARVTRHPDIFISFSLAITCTPSITTCVLTTLAWCSSCTRMFDAETSSHIGYLALWVHHCFPLIPNDTDESPLQRQKQAQDIIRSPSAGNPYPDR